MGTVLTVASGKGGTGKTTTVANVGIEIAKLDKKVLILDADLPMPNLTTLMGIENPPFSLQELLAEEKEFEEVTYRTHGLDLLPSDPSLEKFTEVEIDNFGDIMEGIRDEYEYILIDTSPGLNEYTLEAMAASDETFLIFSPDYLSVSDTKKAKKAAKIMDVKIGRAIANKVTELSILDKLLLVLSEDIEETLFGKSKWRSSMAREKESIEDIGLNLLGKIPRDRKVRMATQSQNPVVTYSPECEASKAFREIAHQIVEIY